MSLNIDKSEMDKAWANRHKSDEFYKYLYAIAAHQTSRKKINIYERPDYIQFCVKKCFDHQDSFDPTKTNSQGAKPSTYSFFWKQISLAIIYKQRKQARRNNKYKTVYVEQEKILDWAERQQENEGVSLRDIVDPEEAVKLKKAFRKYNAAHRDAKAEQSKEGAIKVLEWMEEKEPGFIDSFTTLKAVFKNWTGQLAK